MHLPDDAFFEFLRRLSENNDREWFAEHKPEFQSTVLQPAVELVRRLERPLAKAAPFIEAVAKSHGGSVMRIYRDTRFSKDKTPYKTNVGISLKHAAGKQTGAPELYVHLSPFDSFIAGGCWRPERQVLAAIRAHIDADPKAWTKVTRSKRFRDHFELGGESLKTSPRDYAADHPMIEDLRRIDFVGVSPMTPADATGEAGLQRIVDHFKAIKPLMTFLCDAVGVDY